MTPIDGPPPCPVVPLGEDFTLADGRRVVAYLGSDGAIYQAISRDGTATAWVRDDDPPDGGTPFGEPCVRCGGWHARDKRCA